MALHEGHPVYFVIFFPEPAPGRTLADVHHALRRFVEEVAQRHGAKPPILYGNRQAGWAATLLSADCEGLVGPAVLNGSPLSYWAGDHAHGVGAGGLLGAACLTLMARRGQIGGALVDGPLAFDNAISAAAAREKGIVSDVAGDADVVLVPDLVSGNILAKNLEYLAGGVAAGMAVGLAAPVVLSSRADPPAARLAALALASLMHHRSAKSAPAKTAVSESSLHCAPQPEHACRPTAA